MLMLLTPGSTEQQHTLHSLLTHSPGALAEDGPRRLVCYQLASAVAHVHSAGLAFSSGGLDPRNIVVDGAPGSPHIWLTGLTVPPPPLPPPLPLLAKVAGYARREHLSSSAAAATESSAGGYTVGGYTTSKQSLAAATAAWRCGALSNLDYLLVLNHMAGRG